MVKKDLAELRLDERIHGSQFGVLLGDVRAAFDGRKFAPVVGVPLRDVVRSMWPFVVGAAELLRGERC